MSYFLAGENVGNCQLLIQELIRHDPLISCLQFPRSFDSPGYLLVDRLPSRSHPSSAWSLAIISVAQFRRLGGLLCSCSLENVDTGFNWNYDTRDGWTGHAKMP